MNNIFKHRFFGLLAACFLLIIISSSCKSEDLEPTLAQEKPLEGSITEVSHFDGLLRGALNKLTSSGYWGREVIATNEVRSDNVFANESSGRFATQGQFRYNENTNGIWDNSYGVISLANIIIETDVSTLKGDQDHGKHLQGGAYFLRALAHYDLIRFYGQQHSGGTLGVPIITKFKDDFYPLRNTVDEVKDAIISDLEMAFSLMDEKFDDSEMVSKYAAPALLSRVAIYFGEWNRAKTAAEQVINSDRYEIIDASSFVDSWASRKNVNSIFELAYSSIDHVGTNSLAFIYRVPESGFSYGDLQVMSEVESLFEASDVRAGILGVQKGLLRNMKKYPNIKGWDNIPLIRIEEVVLNLSEALLETGDRDGALTQLNAITSKRGATAYATVTKENILSERRKELMFEGFRWDDLMRTGSSIEVYGGLMNLLETLTYPNNLFAYPIPLSELNANSNMIQNSGY